MKPLVFISYLRASGSGWAQAVYGELQRHFDASEIFFDRETPDVPLGKTYRIPLTNALSTCQVVLALIDSDWATRTRKLTKRRGVMMQHKPPLPTMCQELATAFSIGRAVFPLIIESNRMPDITGLPSELAPLRDLPFVEIYPAYWKAAFEVLISQIESTVREGSRKEEALVEKSMAQFLSANIGDVIGGSLSTEEEQMLRLMKPEDRARYLLQKRMQETAETAALLSQLQAHRNQTAMTIIGNIR